MLTMRYVLIVCVLCVWCACGCAAAQGGSDPDCKTAGTEPCPSAEGSLSEKTVTTRLGGAEGPLGRDRDGVEGGKGNPGLEGAGARRVPCLTEKGETPCVETVEAQGRNLKGAGGCTQSEATAVSGEENGCPSSREASHSEDLARVEGADLPNNDSCQKDPANAASCVSSPVLPPQPQCVKQGNVVCDATGGGAGQRAPIGPSGPPGPAGTAGRVSAAGGEQISSDGTAVDLKDRPARDCKSALKDTINCPVTPLSPQVEQTKELVTLTKSGPEDKGDPKGGSEVREELSKKPHSDTHVDVGTRRAGSAGEDCEDGGHKEPSGVCRKGDNVKATHHDHQQNDELRPQMPQTPDAKGNTPGIVGEKNDGNGSAASPAVNTPEAESAAVDHPNEEPAESTAQAAVEQSDAAQSQTSSASTSTSATDTAGRSQPGSSSPSTDKGQDPKAADSSSGGASRRTGPLMLFVMWLGGLAVTAAC
ncbi:hypothetical protein DQ04_19661000 [Trypanosoma grayi]|uniref:hypothetical protein n=1 Tax=Trypanosoma grayi TaxID=71804 RepID=UPI0004F42A78|nr:hypothetical protein DQ04_19661000 [Trypanosoma grayi]KEG05649.1 hypothetical protein DQ04_19661000 [Trypanosoma grayi]